MHKKPMKPASAFDLYEAVTNKILEKLEQGEIPWQKPWNVKTGAPCNIITGKPYNGINILLLGSQSYDSKFWLTFKQCSEKGGTVKKGEKSTMVVFWTFLEKTDESVKSATDQAPSSSGKIPMLKYYNVFNVNQCSGLDLPRLQKELEDKAIGREHDDIISAQDIVDQFTDKPELKHGFTRACYRPATDEINVPSPENFKSSEEYYATLFHELVHSTGHESRLHRRNSLESRVFGDEDYSKEELVAEMGASFLCAKAGIENRIIDNSAAYIQSWLKALKNDKKLLVVAAGQAHKAANYVTKTHDDLDLTATIEKTKKLDAPSATIPPEPSPSKVDPDHIKQKLRDFGYDGDKLDKVFTRLMECQKSDQIVGFIKSGIIATATDLEDMIRVSLKNSSPSKNKSRSIN